jgi:hypothetical protein
VTSSIAGTQGGITVNAVTLSVFHINFTNSTTDPDRYVGYTDDIGLAYGNRGGGLSFGWNRDNTANARDRNNPSAPDERYDTLNHMQKPNNPNASWKIAVPNGSYSVHLVSGDPDKIDSVYKVNVNGVLTVNGRPTSSNHWIEGTVSITVTNGFITVTNATGSSNNKVDYIDITQTSSPSRLLDGKIGDEKPGGDVVRFTPPSDDGDNEPAAAAHAPRSAQTPRATFHNFVFWVTPVGQQQGSANVAAGPSARDVDAFFAAEVTDHPSLDVKSMVPSLQALSLQRHKHFDFPADWFADAWLADAWD